METGTVKTMADQFSGKVLADKYRVDEILRDGNSGTIYRGTHLAMEKPVAIKILPSALAVDENIARAFSEEAKTLSRIAHPAIANVTDYGKDKSGTEFIITEAIEGESLKDVIKRDGKFPIERANKILRQIAAALAVAHANNVHHLHLTGENIFLSKSAADADIVKILDFGSTRFLDSAELSVNEAEYLAPEQIADSAKAGVRSDVYSLGVILYQMLAGEVPFTAEKPTDILLKQAQEPPLPLSAFRADLPGEINQIVLTALAKNPEMRYQSATDFAAALNRLTTAGAAESLPSNVTAQNFAAVPALQTLPEEPVNNIWKTAFILLAGIGILSAFFIYTTAVKQTNPPTQLATDANSIPVQPINPATGSGEQSLSNMGGYSPDLVNSNTMLPGGVPGMPQQLPGGDGYDPWRNGGKPPVGAPPNYQNYPGYTSNGQTVYIDPNSNSPFMPPEYRVVPVPKNANSDVNVSTGNTTVKGKPPANSNTQAAPANTAKPPQNLPANTTVPKTEATPPATTKKPVAKPTPAPKTAPSGKQQDS